LLVLQTKDIAIAIETMHNNRCNLDINCSSVLLTESTASRGYPDRLPNLEGKIKFHLSRSNGVKNTKLRKYDNTYKADFVRRKGHAKDGKHCK
jgi:hypothetical protein